jgi:hypothetical protein
MRQNVYSLVEGDGSRPWKVVGAKQEAVVGSAATLEQGLEIVSMLNDPERMED